MTGDPELSRLGALSEAIKAEYEERQPKSMWDGSPFAWIMTNPSRRRGAIAERLFSGWCEAHGLDVRGSPDSEADRVIEGLRSEIKYSRLWESGIYRFQQIRDQDYDVLCCLGLSPFAAHCWVFRKSEIVPLIGRVKGLTGQHGGAAGRDTAWLAVDPAMPHPWMEDYGGSLAKALERLRTIVGHGR